MNIIRRRHTNSSHLERFLGAPQVEQLSAAMKDWYGPPILVSGLPGPRGVYAARGGDFLGRIDAGQFGNWQDRALDIVNKMVANGRQRELRWAARQLSQANMGFASFSDLVAESTSGKRRDIYMQKTGNTGVATVTNSLWAAAGAPAAGGAASAAPGGRACTNTTTGAQPGLDDVSPDTRHYIGSCVSASVVANTLLLYDRIFDVAKTMSSTGTESVTGVPTRYQSSTPSAADYAGGNFLFVEVFTALGATGHNWTVCQYRNQAGTDAQTLPSLTGNASAIAHRIDHPIQKWFAPLATGDTGIMDLHQMQCSASVTGAINFVIGHPLAWMGCLVLNVLLPFDGASMAFPRVFDGACLAWLEAIKPASTATNYAGQVTFVHG